jgi:hypothetical protein
VHRTLIPFRFHVNAQHCNLSHTEIDTSVIALLARTSPLLHTLALAACPVASSGVRFLHDDSGKFGNCIA